MKIKPDPSTLKGIRRERRILKTMAESLASNSVPMSNSKGSPRRQIITDLLRMAANSKRLVFNPNLVKAALEINSYNDGFASTLLTFIVDREYTDLINHLKTLQDFEGA